MYSRQACCSSTVPRRSRPGPTAHPIAPHAKPYRFSSDLIWDKVICDSCSTGISTDSKPQALKSLKYFVLALVNGEVKRNVLMPNRIENSPVRLLKLNELCLARDGYRRGREFTPTQLRRHQI